MWMLMSNLLQLPDFFDWWSIFTAHKNWIMFCSFSGVIFVSDVSEAIRKWLILFSLTRFMNFHVKFRFEQWLCGCEIYNLVTVERFMKHLSILHKREIGKERNNAFDRSILIFRLNHDMSEVFFKRKFGKEKNNRNV